MLLSKRKAGSLAQEKLYSYYYVIYKQPWLTANTWLGFGPGMLAGLREGIVQARTCRSPTSGGRRLAVTSDTAGDDAQDRQTTGKLYGMAGRSMVAGGLLLPAGQTWAILRATE